MINVLTRTYPSISQPTLLRLSAEQVTLTWRSRLEVGVEVSVDVPLKHVLRSKARAASGDDAPIRLAAKVRRLDVPLQPRAQARRLVVNLAATPHADERLLLSTWFHLRFDVHTPDVLMQRVRHNALTAPMPLAGVVLATLRRRGGQLFAS